MDNFSMQNVKDLEIPEGNVRTIHDSGGTQLWGMVAYNTKYAGDATQAGTPTPDSPQAINVVKGTQTITLTDGVVSDDFTVGLTGKNLFDGIMEQGGFNNSCINEFTNLRIRCKNFVSVLPNTTYTIRVNQWNTTKGAVCGISISYYSTDDYSTARLSFLTWGNGGDGITFTTPSGCNYIRFLASVGATAGASNGISPSDVSEIQIEEGSSPTAYIAYSPIELAKIGTYQDYIYKSSGNWYVHKAIGISQLGSLTWSYSDTATANKYRMYTSGLSGQYVAPTSNADTPLFISNYFTAVNANSNYNNTVGVASNPSGTALYAYHPDYTATTSPADFKTWLTNNGVVLYYALITPTDTQITDATLISQLDAIHEWLTRYGYQSSVVGSLPIIISQTNL